MASRGPLSPCGSPLVPASLRFEDQPPGLAPHLQDVGPGWHWVRNAADGEDDVRQGVDGVAVNDELSE